MTTYDLRHIPTAILNQGTLNSCSENALQSALDIMMRLAGHDTPVISRMQSYADARIAAGNFNSDAGTYADKMLDAAMTKGLAPEALWGYRPDRLYATPPAELYEHAAKLQGYSVIGVDGISAALSQGKPVLLSFNVRDYVYQQHGPLATLQGAGDTPQLGGHMLTVVGTNPTGYIVQNSWGAGWGDNGYGVISYTQFAYHIDDFKAGYALHGFDGVDLEWTAAKVNVAQHYAAVLGRAAEVEGLEFWSAAGLSDIDLTSSLLTSAEGNIRFAHLTDEQFVHTMYDSVLDRAPDEQGLAANLALLAQGWTRAQIMSATINAVEVSTVEPTAHDYLHNLTNLASYISISMQYDGTRNEATVDVLDAVTASAEMLEVIKVGLPELLHMEIS